MAHVECGMCLYDLVSSYGLVGLMVGRKATTWCSFRLELYHFFSGDPMLIMSRFPPVVPPKGNKKKEKVIWGVVASILVITLALAFPFFWSKNKKTSGAKRNQSVETGEGCFDALKSHRVDFFFVSNHLNASNPTNEEWRSEARVSF